MYKSATTANASLNQYLCVGAGMISDALPKWHLLILIPLAAASPQYPLPFPMQMSQMLSMMPAPPPAVPMPVPIPMAIPMNAAMATEAPEDNQNIAVAVPMPMAVPGAVQRPPPPSPVVFAIPGAVGSVCMNRRNPNCPICPPCSCTPCTPSFWAYCSSCHLKCRCRNAADVPIVLPPRAPLPLPGPAFPMPYPAPSIPQVLLMPFPPPILNTPRHKNICCDDDDSSNDNSCIDYVDCDSDIDSHTRIKKKKRNKKKIKISNDEYRRHLDADRSDSMVVKPMLTYLSEDGDVKFKRYLNKADVSKLMDDEENQEDLKHYKVKKDKMMKTQYDLGHNRKQLVFRPPSDMKVGNLTVSFDVMR